MACEKLVLDRLKQLLSSLHCPLYKLGAANQLLKHKNSDENAKPGQLVCLHLADPELEPLCQAPLTPKDE